MNTPKSPAEGPLSPEVIENMNRIAEMAEAMMPAILAAEERWRSQWEQMTKALQPLINQQIEEFRERQLLWSNHLGKDLQFNFNHLPLGFSTAYPSVSFSERIQPIFHEFDLTTDEPRRSIQIKFPWLDEKESLT